MKEKGAIIQSVDNKYVVVNSKQETKICDDLDSAIAIIRNWFDVVDTKPDENA